MQLNIARLMRGIVQCDEVLGVPRRLGGDATDKELADDKRMARRVKHRLQTALDDWPDKLPEVPPDGTGARLKWVDWWTAWHEYAWELIPQADNSAQQHSIKRELEGLAYVMAEFRS